MECQIQFPSIESESSLFLSVGVPNANLPKSALSKLGSEIEQLTEIRDTIQKKIGVYHNIRRDYPIYTHKNYVRVKILISVIVEFAERYYMRRHELYLKFFNIANQLLGIMDICYKNKVECECNLTRFKQYMDQLQESTFINRDRRVLKKLIEMRKNLNKQDSISKKSEIIPTKQLLKLFDDNSDQINLDLGYIPQTEIDDYLYSLIEDQTITFNTEETKNSLMIFSNDKLNEILIELQNQFNITTREHKIILKCVFVRYCFDFMYQFWPELFKCPTSNAFLKKCSVVGSYSPAKLGLCANPFTEEQYNTPIMNLLHDLSLKSIVDQLSIIQFLVNPLDIVANISIALNMLGEFAKSNATYRRLGRFASMASDIMPKKNDMLSFDDCFSLFFVTFVMYPPVTAPSISEILKYFDMGYSQPMKYSRDIFIASVDHVLNFDIKNVEDDIFADDPLGIAG
ncbi:hypothetical protein TVAG_227610 [Trichomonas vaginalis G3]|uniref:VPS9 domain-containing protein n=1 Tax=Trichomonas vaginalis (strain ATCC PRA-98 / G3) TaxID=412133 RepID=A2ERR3_TRIV3|nr:hypothetical protein TVAGG3_0182770 [Trichomonas vaginalis G3]EAY04644.1 hypothetical protein TVAG_227610 [Trichomonas vaginalis G3]KAI5549419.1 hypothetical protein TVAGG3_0182770 [Trichomonas vaginalis G3]|eukprot:XP_001316867.1 hypothetical protein [Trichomonas vaginalis G3]